MLSVWMILSMLGAGLAWAAPGTSTPSTSRPAGNPLETLSLALAGALEDRDFRDLLRQSLAASPSGSVSLRGLLAKEVAQGSTVAQRLARGLSRTHDGSPGDRGGAAVKARALHRVLGLLEDMPHVDLTVAPGLAAWDAAQVPLTTYTRDGEVTTVEAFEPDGSRVTLDTRRPLPVPVIVLEHHDTSDAVEIVSRAAPDAMDLDHSGVASATAALYGQCWDSTTYKSYPLITGAWIWDIHEGCCNGPEGYAYFSVAGSEKTGNLPASLGGQSTWGTNVWASNFQGPKKIEKTRLQWEWIADGWMEGSNMVYPAAYCQQSATSTSGFSQVAYTIKEDDDGPFSSDDYVGKVQIDHRHCKGEVFDLGLASGWSLEHMTAGIDDVEYTRYKLYCSTQTNCSASVECPNGGFVSCSGSGTCGQGSCVAGEDWVQCGGYFESCWSNPEPCPGGQIVCEQPL
ncbi:MAG TPA: hypothetical protein VEL74_01635 [Thermoanaerobaculia bacterium]|nr:hypothetical protein [Thermoanaerobaculia bacterium]